MIECVSSLVIVSDRQMSAVTFQKFSNVRTICFPFALKSRRAQTLLDAEIDWCVGRFEHS